jgi:hypothetical protein
MAPNISGMTNIHTAVPSAKGNTIARSSVIALLLVMALGLGITLFSTSTKLPTSFPSADGGNAPKTNPGG